MHPLEQLALLGPALGAVVSNIDDGDLDKPTPCAAFTVRGVLEHMVEGATAFGAGFRGEAVPTLTTDGPVLEQFGPALEQLAAAVAASGSLARTLDTPFGPVPGETFARYVVLDGLVHGWDLAVATGQAYYPAPELVEAVHSFALGFLGELRSGPAFAEPIEPPADASPIERLAAFTGRTISPTRA